MLVNMCPIITQKLLKDYSQSLFGEFERTMEVCLARWDDMFSKSQEDSLEVKKKKICLC